MAACGHLLEELRAFVVEHEWHEDYFDFDLSSALNFLRDESPYIRGTRESFQGSLLETKLAMAKVGFRIARRRMITEYFNMFQPNSKTVDPEMEDGLEGTAGDLPDSGSPMQRPIAEYFELTKRLGESADETADDDVDDIAEEDVELSKDEGDRRLAGQRMITEYF